MDGSQNVTATMYVQVARRMRFDGHSLILEDLAPSTVCLTCHPSAAAGHLPTGPFLDEWYRESSGPAIRAVPAVLSLLDASRGDASDVNLTLGLPRIREAGLEYEIQVIEGDLPEVSGACVLFIGPRPTSDSRALREHGAPAVEACAG